MLTKFLLMAALIVVPGALLVMPGTVAVAADYVMPPEVTPALRSACETDVRRLCVGEDPSVAKVKHCIAAKFMLLGKRCQVQIALAGLKR